MQYSDEWISATAYDGAVRVLAARTTQTVETMRQKHAMYPTATAAVGRTMTAAVLMGAMLKNDETVTIQIKGDGPLGQIVVVADASGNVRGYADEPQTHLPLNTRGKLDVAGAVGKGDLYITKDLRLREPYRGAVPLVSGEIAEDFTAYFALSEQTPSAVALGVLVDPALSVQQAGGLIVQCMPGVEAPWLDTIEQHLATLPALTTLLQQGITLEQLIAMVVPQPRYLQRHPVQFLCKCSEERIHRTLIALGSTELADMVAENTDTHVVCHFCNTTYTVTPATLVLLQAQCRAPR